MSVDLKDLKNRVSLVQFAGSKTRLQKKGDRWWGCCPLHTEKTPSFEIRRKDGTEVFFCHGCKVGGDILTFIEESEKLTPAKAIDRLKELAGHSNKSYIVDAEKVQANIASIELPKKSFPVEKWVPFEKALQQSAVALNWLKAERGITPETAKTLRLGFDNKEHILFPRIHNEKILAIKYRSIRQKSFFYAKDMDPRVLFNTETIDILEPVFVTEGEFDAAILEQCGYRAVSMPSAGVRLLPDMRKLLKQATCIYLAGDNDGGVGNAYMKQLARELGENTYIVNWPDAKDANQFFLKNCGGDVVLFKERVEELREKSHSTPVEGFSSVLDRLRTTQGTDLRNDPTRLHFPWQDVDDINFNPRGSVVVVYSTYSGTGKTVFTTQVAMHEAKRGETVVVYSPELRDENYIALLAAQWLGSSRQGGLDRANRITSQDYALTAEILEFTYPPQEKPHGGPLERRQIQFYVGYAMPESETDKIIDFIEFTIRVTGATRFVIDTLHRIISGTGKESLADIEGRVVKRLEAIANKYGTIFILIGQSNKEAEGVKEKNRNEYGVLRGSRELSDVAYGVYLLHRPRMPKDAKQSVNLLAPEGELVLMKDRGKGPGNSTVPMLYRRECSKFVVREVTEAFAGQPEAEPEESMFS